MLGKEKTISEELKRPYCGKWMDDKRRIRGINILTLIFKKLNIQKAPIFYLSIQIFDRAIRKIEVRLDNLALLCAVAIRLAIKLETHKDILNYDKLTDLGIPVPADQARYHELEVQIATALDFALWGYPRYSDFLSWFSLLCEL